MQIQSQARLPLIGASLPRSLLSDLSRMAPPIANVCCKMKPTTMPFCADCGLSLWPGRNQVDAKSTMVRLPFGFDLNMRERQRRPLFPVLEFEIADSSELASVVSDENRTTRQSNGCNHQIIWSNWYSLSLQICADRAIRGGRNDRQKATS